MTDTTDQNVTDTTVTLDCKILVFSYETLETNITGYNIGTLKQLLRYKNILINSKILFLKLITTYRRSLIKCWQPTLKLK